MSYLEKAFYNKTSFWVVSNTGSSWLTTVHSAIVWNYNEVEQRDLWHVPEVMAAGHINKIWAFGNQPGLTTDHKNAAASFSRLSSQISHPFGSLGPTPSPNWVPIGLGLASHSNGSHTLLHAPITSRFIYLFWRSSLGKRSCRSAKQISYIQRLHAAILEVVATLKVALILAFFHIGRPHGKLAIFCSWRLSLKKVSGSREEDGGPSGSGSIPKVSGDTSQVRGRPKSVGSSGAGSEAWGDSQVGGDPGLATYELGEVLQYGPGLLPGLPGPTRFSEAPTLCLMTTRGKQSLWSLSKMITCMSHLMTTTIYNHNGQTAL